MSFKINKISLFIYQILLLSKQQSVVAILILFGFSVIHNTAYALSCSAGGTKAGSLLGGGSVCYCDLNFQGKDYTQAVSPVGMGVPESSTAVEVGGELAGVALDEKLGGGSGLITYGTMVYGGSKSGGNIKYSDAVNTKICSDANCTSYITPSQYKSGVRYYFQNTSAGGGKQVFSCEWYGSAWLGSYYFKNARMDVPGVVDLMSPSIQYRYYTQYTAQNASGAIVPNTVTATDDKDPNPVVTCTPALTSYLPVGNNAISCTAKDASNNVTGPVSFSTEVLKANQWVTFYPINDIEFGEPAPTLNVSLSSGLTPVYSATGPCSVNSSGVVSVTGAGVCTITATHPGNNFFYDASDRKQSFTINPARTAQTITFASIPEKTAGDPSFLLGVTGGGSGNPVKLTTRLSPNVCFVALPNTLYVFGAGTCKVEAFQDGNASYKPASALLEFTVKKAVVSLSLADVGEKAYGNPAFNVRASSSVPPYLLSYSTTGVCSNVGTLVTLTGVGTCTVTVAVAASSAYDATNATLNISVLKGNQLINFPALNRASVSNAQLTLAATGGTSGEPIVYTPTGACSMSGNVVTFSEGLCEITANQAGNANYNAAAPVSRSLVFAKASQTISFPAISSSSISGGQFSVSATGGASGNAVTFSASGCSISGNTVTFTAGTSCSITASQAGNADYNAATDVTQSVLINASGSIVTDCNNTAATGVPKLECEALLALFNSTGGANWTTKTNWNTNSAVSTWSGVKVNSGRVTELYLSNQNLVGVLPPEIGNLTKVFNLDLANNPPPEPDPWDPMPPPSSLPPNQLTGTIPTQIGQMVELRLLQLQGNQLAGQIPAELGSLPNLYYLDLSSNQLSGTIPVLANSSAFSDLQLANNKLSGAIPTWLGSFAPSSLLRVDLENNQFSGTIPSAFGQHAFLRVLKLAGNRLNGVIPSLSGMTMLNSDGLTLGYNALSGETSGTATARQANWRDTQTAPPTAITATVLSETSVALNWTPMLYQSASGYYQVQYATTSGGLYDLAGVTVDKAATGYTINNLKSGTTYYFVVVGYTSNTSLTSDFSAEVSATTTALNQTQTITFPTLANVSPNDTQILNASASSGLAVSYSTTGSCSVTANEVTATGVGTCTVTASQAGNGQYSAATAVQRSFTISKLAQIIDFPPLQEIAPTSNQTLSATASSGLTVSYSASGNCSISSNQVTANNAGMCTVTASQAGNTQYNAATDVVRYFDMNKIAQTITFPALPDIIYGQPAPTLSATVTPATLSVQYAASGVCSVSGGVLSVNSAGTCTVTASQPGDTLHTAATPVSHSFTITAVEGTLAFEPIDSPSYANLSFTVTATRSGATGAISYASTTSTVCTVSGNTVSILQAGTCELTANQVADANTAATQANAKVVINPVPLKVWIADESVQEGSSLPAFSATNYEGFVRGETSAVLSGTLAFTTTAPTPIIAGSYDINASGLSSPNYTISYLPAKLTVGGIGLLVTETQFPVLEGQSGTIGVKLTGQPGGTVSVTLTPDNFVSIGAGAMTPITVNFTPSNWDTVQNITVTPVDDTIPHGIKWSFIKATLNGNYSGVTEMTVRTLIYDNDPGVIIEPYSKTLNLTEGSGAMPYTLRLSSIPTQPVTITLTPEARLHTDVTTVTFAADETALQMQYIQVTAVDDNVFSNLAALINHSITTGDGAGYTNARIIDPVKVNINDNDPGVIIKPLEISANEGGTTGSYSVQFNSAPTSPVTLTLSTNSQQLSLNKSSLIFAADSSALTPQTVIVTAVDDNISEGAHQSNISHSIAVGNGDGGFYAAGKSLESVKVNIGDKTVLPPEIPAPSNLQINTTPTSNILTWTAAQDANGYRYPSYYLYRSDKPNQPLKTINGTTWTDTLQADVTKCGQSYTYSVQNSAGGNPSNSVTGIIPCVTNTAKVLISPVNIAAIEGGTTVSYAVSLESIPKTAVTLRLSYDPKQVTVDKTTLLFAADASALTPQTVTISALQDNQAEGAHTTAISHHIQTGDNAHYVTGTAVDTVTIAITETANNTTTPPAQTAKILISPLSINTIEGDATGSYRISLESIPKTAVTLYLSYDPKQVTVDKTALVFAADASALTPQTVTVSALEDNQAEGAHTTAISHHIQTGDNVQYVTGTLLDAVNVRIDDKTTVTPPPVNGIAAPSYLQISTSELGNTLTWKPAQESNGYTFTDYHVYRNNQLFSYVSGTTTTDTIRTAVTQCGQIYVYTVQNVFGGANSNAVSGVIPCTAANAGAHSGSTNNSSSTTANGNTTGNNSGSNSGSNSGTTNDNSNTTSSGSGSTNGNSNTGNAGDSAHNDDTANPALSLLELIHKIPGFETLSITQFTDNKWLFALPDSSLMGMFTTVSSEQPTQNQASSFSFNHAEGHLSLYLNNGTILKTVPSLIPETLWQSSLQALGFSLVTVSKEGTWLFEGYGVQASMRPQWNIERVADETPLGLSFTPMPCDSVIVTLTFMYNGMKYQQHLYPVIADFAAIQTYVQQKTGLQLEMRERGAVGIQGTSLTFYPHWSLTTAATDGSTDIVQQDNSTFSLNYANGKQQKVCITAP